MEIPHEINYISMKFFIYAQILPQSKPPDIETELEYVHGYRAKDQRNNIKYLRTGNIVYTAAAVGIVLDIKSNT